MARRMSAVVVGLLVLGLCGGCGSSSSHRFAGTWGGTWVDAAGQFGSAHLVVSGNGAVTGTCTNYVANVGSVLNGTVTGTITDAGAANLVFTYTIGAESTVRSVIGTVTKGANGRVTGQLNEYQGIPDTTSTPFTTATVVFWAPASYPFTGRWAGTWQDNTGQQGALDLTATTDGTLSGTVTNTTVSMNGQVLGVVDAAGAMRIWYLYTGAAFQGIGTVALGNQHITGTLGTYNGTTQIATATVDLQRVP